MTEPKRIPFPKFIASCARAFDVPREKLQSDNRHKPFVLARFAAAALMRAHRPDASLPEIGRRLGGRDHTTVLSALRRAKSLIATDADFRARYLAAERDALSWVSGQAPEPKMVSLVDLAPRAIETPSAVTSVAVIAKPETVEYVPTGGKTRTGAPVRDIFDQSIWFANNDQRFRRAMLAAHPERFSGRVEAAE